MDAYMARIAEEIQNFNTDTIYDVFDEIHRVIFLAKKDKKQRILTEIVEEFEKILEKIKKIYHLL